MVEISTSNTNVTSISMFFFLGYAWRHLHQLFTPIWSQRKARLVLQWESNHVRDLNLPIKLSIISHLISSGFIRLVLEIGREFWKTNFKIFKITHLKGWTAYCQTLSAKEYHSKLNISISSMQFLNSKKSFLYCIQKYMMFSFVMLNILAK